MHPSEEEVARIVASLTKAQRATILRQNGTERAFPSLREKELMVGGTTKINCGSLTTFLDQPELTSLGLAVRQRLLGGEG